MLPGQYGPVPSSYSFLRLSREPLMACFFIRVPLSALARFGREPIESRNRRGLV